MQRDYFVAIVAPPEIDAQALQFKKDLHDRFGTRSALKSPAHITLFPPFKFEEENETALQQSLEKAARGHERFEVVLQNFDRFSDRVIFIHVEPNEGMQKLRDSIVGVFSALPGVKFREAQQNFHPHMTIGNRNWTEDGFQQAWEEYGEKKFAGKFDAAKICLLKLAEKWDVVFSGNLD